MAYISLAIAPLIFSGCSTSLCESVTMSRQTSIDGRLDARLIQESCGATTGYVYKVYISLHGAEEKGNAVFVADKTKGLKISWEAEKRLLISYDRARIFNYTNFWQSKDIDNFSYIVSITEQRL